MRAADRELLQDRCPDCGDQLVAGPDGVLFCNTDGWGRPVRALRWTAPVERLVACPDDGEPLLRDAAGRLRCPFCGHAW
jgi:uncharacterized Zn finger protein (UPF0148 family)